MGLGCSSKTFRHEASIGPLRAQTSKSPPSNPSGLHLGCRVGMVFLSISQVWSFEHAGFSGFQDTFSEKKVDLVACVAAQIVDCNSLDTIFLRNLCNLAGVFHFFQGMHAT